MATSLEVIPPFAIMKLGLSVKLLTISTKQLEIFVDILKLLVKSVVLITSLDV